MLALILGEVKALVTEPSEQCVPIVYMCAKYEKIFMFSPTDTCIYIRIYFVPEFLPIRITGWRRDFYAHYFSPVCVCVLSNN